ncbi:MAG TPA: amidohydrolase family protein [Bryobacteraceae bacterium]|jgi:imidazolonepropionase-like amidohydrolase/ABC-type multidrug transport system permease subunit
MNAYIAQIRMNLRLTFRDRGVLIFGYVFPLMFLFMFGQLGHADQGSSSQIVNMVLTIGVLGSGFFGAAMRAITERENNILRRFKVAPIDAGPILVSSLVVGLVTYLPLVVIVISLAQGMWGMAPIENKGSVFLFLGIGVIAFRAMGGMIASVANSMQEGQILVQMFYMPMLLLGGATIPLTVMPEWLQTASQFLPSTHFSMGMKGIFQRHESITDNLSAVGALLLTAVLGTFLGVKLFRWDKEEKLRPSAKFWLVAVLAPFLALGAWQSYAKTNLAKDKMLERDSNRNHTFLIRNARLFLGDGTVIEQGSVLVKNGKIAEVFTGAAPDAKSLKAESIEAAGKTLLPGLIDVHVHLGANGGFASKQDDYTKADENIDHELAAYLYSGVTAVKSAGDTLDAMLKHREAIASGETLGAELFTVGPMFTVEGGHGAEALQYIPENVRATVQQQIVRLPKSADEARAQVAALKAKGVDGIKAILDAGAGSTHWNRLDPQILRAIGDAARQAGLPLVVHTGDARDVADALDAGASGIEHGSFHEVIPAALFARMKEANVTYDPTLTAVEGIAAFVKQDLTPLQRSLVIQTAPPDLLESTKALMVSPSVNSFRAAYAGYPVNLDVAQKNLVAAQQAGVTLVTGTDSGNPLVLHGPAVHRELQLWVAAGVPPAAALQGATYNAAKLLRADRRIGLIRGGYEATLLLVDGNPLQEISATERISIVFLKGEAINRTKLLERK